MMLRKAKAGLEQGQYITAGQKLTGYDLAMEGIKLFCVGLTYFCFVSFASSSTLHPRQ